jgi:acetyl-CoA carboxylase biotin carboxyl carrier protein
MNESAELQAVERLLALAVRYDLDELEVEENGLKIRLRAVLRAETPSPSLENEDRYQLWPPTQLWTAPETPEEGPSRSPTAVPLRAPLTGTFYRAAGPDSPAFVEEGDRVQEGQTIGLIEAMKVFSEVPSDAAGTVIELAVKNGTPVQHGDVLAYLEPD